MNRELGLGGWYYFLKADLGSYVPCFREQVSWAEAIDARQGLYFKCRYNSAGKLAEYRMISVAREPVEDINPAHRATLERLRGKLEMARGRELFLTSVDDRPSEKIWNITAPDDPQRENGFVHAVLTTHGNLDLTHVRPMLVRGELYHGEEFTQEERLTMLDRAVARKATPQYAQRGGPGIVH